MDKELTKDVIQNLFIDIWEKRDRILKVYSWNAYLRKSLYRKMLHALKKNKITQTNVTVDNLPITTPSYEDLLINMQSEEAQTSKLIKAINQLPEEEQKVIKLRFFEELSYEDIAQKTGKTKRTIYNQIFSAIKKLKKFYLFL